MTTKFYNLYQSNLITPSEYLNIPQISSDTFTTPILDFTTHSEELSHLVDRVNEYRDQFFCLKKHTATSDEQNTESFNELLQLLINSTKDKAKTTGAEEKLKELLVSYENDSKELMSCREKYVVEAVELALERFNNLTRPPFKKIPNTNRNESSIPYGPCKVSSTHAFDPTLNAHQKAFYSYLRGRLFNTLTKYNKDAEDNLTKSVKLDPHLVKAWDSLGECICKKGDMNQAQLCFQSALIEKRNKTSLRNLAMIVRQCGSSPEEIRNNIQKSIALCKEAIQCDMEDSRSWYGLGTSYLKLYFNATRNSKDLVTALTAYNRAESFLRGDTSIDNWELFHNRAITHQYLENYQQAIHDYWTAGIYDPSTPCISLIVNIVEFALSIGDVIKNKLNIKPRTLEAITTKLATLSNDYSVDTTANIRLLAEIPHNLQLPQEFIGIDPSGNIRAVSIFNVKRGVVSVGDYIAMVIPMESNSGSLKEIKFSVDQEIIEYQVIRVDSPEQLFVNGTRLESNHGEFTTLSIDIQQ
ncbi:hypothetical protein HK098_001484 [Nowakowskiella sp. JEL0407]|nr:hypothetical protein HK098_001484 [Nowakowskiella sp. JEL0407]